MSWGFAWPAVLCLLQLARLCESIVVAGWWPSCSIVESLAFLFFRPCKYLYLLLSGRRRAEEEEDLQEVYLPGCGLGSTPGYASVSIAIEIAQ